MHLPQTPRPRESSFDLFPPSTKQLFIDTSVNTLASTSHLQQQQQSLPQQQRQQLSQSPSTSDDVLAWHECASYSDIQSALAHGVAPSRILYTNPTTSLASLRFAARLGVNCVAVDSADDVLMIKMHNPKAQLVFRINAGDVTASTAALQFAVDTANDLLDEAAAMQLQVVAVNFYVTSVDLAAFRRAIDSSSQLVEMALAVERKLEAIGVSADLIASATVANEQDVSVESPLAFPDFTDAQVAHNAFALVS